MIFLPGDEVTEIGLPVHCGPVRKTDFTDDFNPYAVRWTDGCAGLYLSAGELKPRYTREKKLTYNIPVEAIRNFFIKHSLPLVMTLDNLPEPSVMRKVKYRADQLETRWEELFNSIDIDSLLDGLEGDVGVVADRGSHLRFAYRDELRSTDTWLTSRSNVNLDSIPVGRVKDKLAEILDGTRFEPAVLDSYGEKYLGFQAVAPERREAARKTLQARFVEFEFYVNVSMNTMGFSYARKAVNAAKAIRTEWKELYRQVLRNSFGTKPVYSVPTHDTSANLEKYLTNRRRTFKDNADAIATLPIAEHGTLSSRTWGIEVESGGARGVYPPDYWDRKGDGSLRSAYTDDYDYDEPDEDDEDNDWSDYDTGEFVSPVLHSFHSRGLEGLVTELSLQPQNDTAGVHVHVGAKDLTARQIGGLVFAYEMIEPLIEYSYYRETREYCQRRDIYDTMDIIKAAKTVKYKSYNESRRGDGSKYIEPHNRYVSLNLCALDAHGTVEFRAMGPVYKYEHLIKWAHFCREMVNLAAKDVPSREWSAVKTFADVRALFAKYGSETPAIVFDNMVVDHRLVEDRMSTVEMEQKRALVEA